MFSSAVNSRSKMCGYTIGPLGRQHARACNPETTSGMSLRIPEVRFAEVLPNEPKPTPTHTLLTKRIYTLSTKSSETNLNNLNLETVFLAFCLYTPSPRFENGKDLVLKATLSYFY